MTTLTDPDTVLDLLTPIRRRILAALDSPDSASGLARRLGSTRQKVNYHVRALEGAGLIELHECRASRGLTERVMRRTTDAILVDPTAFDVTGLTRADIAGLAAVMGTARDLLEHAADVTAAARHGGGRVAASVLDTEIRIESPAALRAMLAEISSVLGRYDCEQGLLLRVATTALPSVPAS